MYKIWVYFTCAIFMHIFTVQNFTLKSKEKIPQWAKSGRFAFSIYLLYNISKRYEVCKI